MTRKARGRIEAMNSQQTASRDNKKDTDRSIPRRKQYLRPVSFTGNIPEDIVSRNVRKDNTILYNSNRYTVPIGTYQPGLELH